MKREPITPQCVCGHFIFSHSRDQICHACKPRKMRHPFQQHRKEATSGRAR